ncbi:MAG TPA: penicillin acylase family protein [Bryobacteraceae bacterium]|nr:penicillin acylase family protein [Bryobacteraceae bacterium]
MPALHASTPLVLNGMTGLQGKVEILLDEGGVPHIRARSEADAVFGLGFMQARDRLWQLEYMRRLGYGRLAEAVGCPVATEIPKCPAFQADALFRILGVEESGAATWATYTGHHRTLVNAFVAGLNAATNMQKKNGLPPEFRILGVEPDHWKPEDVMVMAKVIVWGVDQNWTQELLRLQLSQIPGITGADVAALTPAYTADGPVIVPNAGQGLARNRSIRKAPSVPSLDGTTMATLLKLHADISERTGFGGQGIGSNGFALARSRTNTGEALLAADPHLPSQIPSIFYRVHLTGGQLDAIGVAAIGMPGITMGHNGKVAWGWTNANADVQDLYIEKLLNPAQWEYNGKVMPVTIRPELIKVKLPQGVVVPVPLSARSTLHGPLISDLVIPAGSGPTLALRWAALDADDDSGIRTTLDANRANNRNQFLSAMRSYKVHPQNLTWADHAGKIGYLLVGTIPDRAPGHTGAVPVDGATSALDWQGYVPAAQLPALANPDEGYVMSSNNQIAPASYPHVLGSSYASPYRAQRLQELLNSRSRFGIGDLEAMQADVLAAHARELVPYLTKLQRAPDTMEGQALQLLRNWDFQVTAGSAAAAVFEAWYIQLAESIFADDLGPVYTSWTNQMHFVSMAMSAAIRNDAPWCDNRGTPGKTETCEDAMGAALTAGLARMAGPEFQATSDVNAWQWGKAHNAVFFHQPFDAHPQLGPQFSRRVRNGGDKHTLNVASSPTWTDYDQRHIALYRQIIDFADIDNSRWIAAPGQSGVLGSPHYDDLIDEWLQVGYHPMRYSTKAVNAGVVGRLELLP